MGFFVWKQVCKLRAELEQMRAKRFFMVLGSVLVLPLARARQVYFEEIRAIAQADKQARASRFFLSLSQLLASSD